MQANVSDAVMITAAEARSGKGHRDENFPVASWLIHPRHRGPILAFYEFVRTADDIADHPSLPPQEKLALLDRLEAELLGSRDDDPVGVALRSQLDERHCRRATPRTCSPRSGMDVTKLRYRDWDDLIDYCRYSAMPVGRFVLDVHGESRATWPANDALCAALQIINHLQDCGRTTATSTGSIFRATPGRRRRGRRALGAERASPALLDAMRALARRTGALLCARGGRSPPASRTRGSGWRSR